MIPAASILSRRYVIEPHRPGVWRIDCETWFIDRHGNKEWRCDIHGVYETREAAETYLRNIDRPSP